MRNQKCLWKAESSCLKTIYLAKSSHFLWKSVAIDKDQSIQFPSTLFMGYAQQSEALLASSVCTMAKFQVGKVLSKAQKQPQEG